MAEGQLVTARAASMLPRSLSEARGIAVLIAESRLFGCKTEAEAFSLMLLADAEGLHPAAAARDYHIIDGKPSLKADAMLARYMAAGGKIEWLRRESECCSATFTHPSSGSFTVTWDKERATLAGFWGKATWKKHPIQMLSARVISEGVRASFPGVVSGVYTPEEVQDFDDGGRITVAPDRVPASDPVAGHAEKAPDATKAASREMYAELQKGLRSCSDAAELTAWGAANKARINKLPADWCREIKDEYGKEKAAFLALEEAELAKENGQIIEGEYEDAEQ